MNSYDAMCNKAVKRFIRTVAIIDDEATYDMKLPSRKKKNKVKTVKPPVTSLMVGNQDADFSTTNEDSTKTDFQDNRDVLDAKVVINAFADMHIACCIQRPKHEEPMLERAIKLATTADVLVLDWVLDKNNITLPRDIIKRVLEEDKSKGGRMRLIVVYTSHNFVDQMLKDLKEDADDVYADGLDMDKKRLFIRGECLRIVILNKKTTVNPPSEARIVPFDQLPDNIISEYVELVRGIIPGATLHSIAAIREKTHELLTILNNKLDGAYCLHRALVLEPSDSVDFAMNLITNEILTVIQADIQARQFVDQKGIKPWLNSISIDKPLKKDVQQWIDKKEKISKTNEKKLIKALYNDNQTEGLDGCRELSHLLSTSRDVIGRSYYSKLQKPFLQLGTILRKTMKNAASEWFLCITPLCDCVRLKEVMNFLFLQLCSGKENADLIVKTQDGTFEPLIVKKGKLRPLTIPFKPTNGSDRIKANPWRKEWRFKSNGTSYQWIAELRYTKALAIVHYVAANTSRVGVDEFEWLRLQATLKN